VRGKMKIKLLFQFYLAVILLFSTSCTDKKLIDISIKVVNNHDTPIEKAVIKLNGESIGTTDLYGNLKTKKKINDTEYANIEITKKSNQYYFAPFFKKVSLKKNHKNPGIEVKAMLFFVPKPKPSNQETQPLTEKNTDNSLNNDETEDSIEKIESATITNPSKSNPKDNLALNQNQIPAEKEPESYPEEERLIPASPIVLNNLETKNENNIEPKIEGKSKQKLITIHTRSDEKPIQGVKIYLGNFKKSQLVESCNTNKRGRCVIRVPSKSSKKIYLLAQRKGFQAQKRTLEPEKFQKVTFNLKKGLSIDVLTLSKSFNYIKGLKGIDVSIGGKKVGETDFFGHYAHTYNGQISDLVEIKLESDAYLPKVFTTDFIVGEKIRLKRYFTSKKPRKPIVYLTNLKHAGKIDQNKSTSDLDSNIRSTDKIETIASDVLFKSKIFSFISEKDVYNLLPEEKSIEDVIESGWKNSDLVSSLDAVIVPTIVFNNPPVIELSVINSDAKVITAAKADLEGEDPEKALRITIDKLVKSISESFPFEGSVIKVTRKKIKINIGSKSGFGIQKKRYVDIFGTQRSETGNEQKHTKVAKVKIIKVNKYNSVGIVTEIKPRSNISYGDLAVLNAIQNPDGKTVHISVTEKNEDNKIKPIKQANLYYKSRWIGSTNSAGYTLVSPKSLPVRGHLKIVKSGFNDFTKEVSLPKVQRINIKLKRQTSNILVESNPPGALVKIEGKSIGITPLNQPIKIPSGFVKIEIIGSSDTKKWLRILELDQGTVDLTGPRLVELEKDLLAIAEQYSNSGSLTKAIEVLLSVPKEHSDYLHAMHRAGEIYLKNLKEPAKAAKSFSIVTTDPSVKQFIDKRFIASHINEGISLFLSGENLAKLDETPTAIAHFQKGFEVLKRVEPFLRHLSSREYNLALHNVYFHKALSYHRIWELTQDKTALLQTNRLWENYIESNVDDIPISGAGKAYISNAKIYHKQTRSTLDSRSPTL